jgi:hypothetical protein
MPLLRIQRYKSAVSVLTTYEQAFTNLTISSPTEFFLGTGPTWAAGTYSLASYSGTFTGSISDVSVNVGSTGRTAAAPVLDTVNKRITVALS